MKKLTISICSLLLILSACAAPAGINEPSPDISVPPSTPAMTETPTPPVVDDELWMDAYTDVILAAGDNAPRMITLADVTRDGIPELFFADLANVNIWIARGYSYTDGQITDIVLPDEWMPPSLELYHDAAGGPVWIASQTARNGAAEYIHTWYICNFSDLSSVKETFMFGWIERTEDGNTWEYLLYGDDGTGRYEDAAKLSFEDIQTRQEQFFASFELLDTNSTYVTISDFTIGYDGTDIKPSNENLDIRKLHSYFENWQSETRGSPDNRAPYSEPPGRAVL